MNCRDLLQCLATVEIEAFPFETLCELIEVLPLGREEDIQRGLRLLQAVQEHVDDFKLNDPNEREVCALMVEIKEGRGPVLFLLFRTLVTIKAMVQGTFQ